ncbi:MULTISPECIES: pyruvate dehydrogenase complex dihydrolipoamide acetyltransferase [unclassified Chelatococcus]|uniref:pyruvate dehydrogenase complex dihydrolipoamide acetyltransferase n=1 Tax=unclassified Chelatococcus TaxID=2638111 RepID=UPI001BCAA76B|nr:MULTISPECIES: pyruvate dehydrogenase complex dihydrolipoamide acetyltransferase [unclassified Chelatococcus]CAH1672714.1 Dihydrolipoyllysine-residue acetyltransferase component of pyruvate dehydrogenase complex [Hyphomicrobiales bacterium]MBS7738625.1 pyruvate dehydrogenase complex dihydrolipoamide acetyltransferase [Chelatococcus sp. HY11]MBX3543029.1 pyruvate dehydrogenase complex dihydrolipoamide acetyltransferase [Chelatococcus sp.]MCO5076845.1 pyruvate dehydrogenase complex dihydrolipoa
MPANILMPALSPTMEKGNLTKWLKKEGDKVSSGDVLAEIETDKATMEVEAVDEGILAKIVVPEGTADVPVNELIAVIASDGEDPKAVAAGAGKGETAAAPAKSDASKAEAPAQAKPTEAKPAQTTAAPEPQAIASAQPAQKPAAGEGGRVFASPLAKRLAREGGIDIAAVQGSGPHGRVVERDVKAALAGGTAKAAPAAAAAATSATPTPKAAVAPLATGMADEQVKRLFEPGSFEEIPHDSMRKTIARRLTESKQTIPHFYLSVDCELDALLALREQINAAAPKDGDGKPAYKVSVNDFVIKALAVSLMRVPDANVSWTDSAMLRHKHADVGVAVAIPGGLITPVVRKAETKTLSTISNEMKDYAARARTRKLKPEEYQGGSTAVSNLGMFGIKDFSAVINPPHATILAVGAGEKRVVVKNNAPAIATVMTVTLSTDHRAVDGALGAELISAFKQLIENPMGMLV